MARALVGADSQFTATECRPAHSGQLLLIQRGVDLHQGEGLKNVDLTDVGARDSALVGEGAHDCTGQDTIAVTDFDAVDGTGAVLMAAPAASGSRLALRAIAPAAPAAGAILAVAPALEGSRHERALGIKALLAAFALARTLVVLSTARAVIANGQSEQGRGELGGVDAQLLGSGLHQLPVHGQAPAAMSQSGLIQKFAGPMRGDVGGGGQGDLLQLRARQALDLAEFALLLGGQERHGLTVSACTAGAADAVHIGFGLAGHVEVDHESDAVHVQTAGGDVGGHEHVQSAHAQALDQALALPLGHVAGDGGRLDPAARQFDGDILRGGLGAHEDDGGLRLGDRQDAGDGADLMAEGHDCVGLMDRVDGGGLRGDLDPDGVDQVLAGHGLNGRRHGCGEQRGASLFGQRGGDRLDVLGESHAEHLVGLVEDEVPHVVQDQGALVDEVDDASRGSDNHLGAVLESADLRAVGSAAVYGDDVQSARAPRHINNGVCALKSQLSSGGQDQGLNDGLTCLNGVQQGQAEGGGLARAGLGHADDVAAGQQYRNGLALDVGGVLVAHIRHGFEQVGRQAQVGEGNLLRRFGDRLVAILLVVLVDVDEGGVTIDLVLIGVLIAVVGVVVPIVLGVGLGQGQVDVVVLVVVLDVLGILRGVGGGGGREGVRGGGRRRFGCVGCMSRMRRSDLLG